MLPQDSVKLFPNAPKTYLGEYRFTDAHLGLIPINHLPPLLGIPNDLDTNKIKEVHTDFKKTKKIKGRCSPNTLRPDLSDTEIALINATFWTVPHDIIAHTLNIDEARLKKIYKATNRYNIPALPLVMITDSSRYWSEDEERKIYNSDELNHIDDPLTEKELLRQTFFKEEGRKDTKILSNHTIGIHSSTTKEISTLQYIKRSISLFESPTDYCFGTYGYVPNHLKGLVDREGEHSKDLQQTEGTNGVTNVHLMSYRTYRKVNVGSDMLFHLNYWNEFKYVTSPSVIEMSNYLLNEISKGYDLSESDVAKLTLILSTSYNRYLSYLYYDNLTPIEHLNYTNGHFLSTHSGLKECNTLHIKYSNNRKEALYWGQLIKNKEIHFNLPYQLTRPHYIDRGFCSPIKDLRGEFRYIMPYNCHKPKVYNTNLNLKDKEIKLCFICNHCDTMLSCDTVYECEHFKLKVVRGKTVGRGKSISARISKRIRMNNANDYNIALSKPLIYTLFVPLGEIDKPNVSLHYYTHIPNELKEHVDILTYIKSISRDISPLYTNFTLPMHRTIQEI